LTSLVKKIDAASKEKKVKSFVIVMGDEEKLPDQIKSLAEKEGIKTTVFAVDNPAGPKGYNISKNADVTVLLYKGQKVEVNHAYAKGELNAQAITTIVSDIDKIAPSGSKK
jgi:hypothetical protein